MLHYNDHADSGCLVGIVDVVDCTTGTAAGSFEDFGAGRAEIEVAG